MSTVGTRRSAVTHVSGPALHDSQVVDHLLMQGNTGSDVWAESAYHSEEMEANLRTRGLKSRIHRKGTRGKPLGEQGNPPKTDVRGRKSRSAPSAVTAFGRLLILRMAGGADACPRGAIVRHRHRLEAAPPAQTTPPPKCDAAALPCCERTEQARIPIGSPDAPETPALQRPSIGP